MVPYDAVLTVPCWVRLVVHSHTHHLLTEQVVSYVWRCAGCGIRTDGDVLLVQVAHVQGAGSRGRRMVKPTRSYSLLGAAGGSHSNLAIAPPVFS